MESVNGATLFAIKNYEQLAVELASLAGARFGSVIRDRFPDGEHYLRVDGEVNDRHVVLVGGTVDHDATLELYDLACAIVEYGAATLTLIVPYFGYSTMERAVHAGEAVMAKNRARILSSIPRAKLGNQILLLDLHSEGIPHYFEGTIRPFHVYAKPVIQQLARELAGDSFILGSTDAGRAKWVESLANDLHVPAAFVFKRRTSGETTEVMAVSASLKGETVVIYDDMIRTGSSLMNAARAYREAGAGRLIAIATHGVFPGNAAERIAESGLFAQIAVTDSHPNAKMDGVIVRRVAGLFLPYLKTSGGLQPAPRADQLAAVLVGVAGDGALDTVPRILRRELGLVPRQARGALRAIPVACQIALEVVVPGTVGVAMARERAVAVRRRVVAVVVVGLVVVARRREVVAPLVVARAVGRVGAVRAVPRVADGVFGAVPRQRGLALHRLPVAGEVVLDVVPLPVAVLRARLPAVAVRGLVVVPRLRFIEVRARGVRALPVLGFSGGVDPLAGRVARSAARDRADGAADEHADRSERSTDGGADGGRTGRADARSDRMRARLAGDGVTIHVSVFSHEKNPPCCEGPLIRPNFR